MNPKFNHYCFPMTITGILGTIFLSKLLGLAIAIDSNDGDAGASLRSDIGADQDDDNGGFENNPIIPLYRLIDAFVQFYEIEDSLDDSECGRDISKIIDGVKNSEIWSIKMLDSFGKPKSGILHLNIKWAGSYQECINLVEDDQAPIDVQFCWLNIHIQIPPSKTPGIPPSALVHMPPLRSAICVPKSCSSEELLILFRHLQGIVSPFLPADVTKSANISNVECSPTERNHDRDRKAIITSMVILVFVVITTAATVYDLFYRPPVLTQLPSKEALLLLSESDSDCDNGKEKNSTILNIEKLRTYQQSDNEGKMAAILLLFSIYTNGKKLFKITHPEGSLECLHGMKFVSTAWIIVGHSFMMFGDQLVDNTGLVLHLMHNPWMTLIYGAHFAVDSFLTISGCLVSYQFLRYAERANGKVSWIAYYALRYIRLTPLLILIIFIRIYLADYLHNDAFGNMTELDKDREICPSAWWASALFIQNIVYEQECLGITWYLALDMQCYIVAPIILIYLDKKPNRALVIGLVTVIASFSITVFLSLRLDLDIAVDAQHMLGDTVIQFRKQIYTKTWCRIAPYIIGIGLGTVLHKTKCRIYMGKLTTTLGWILAAFSGFMALYLPYLGLSVGFTALYYAVHGSVWSLAISWVILACCTGYGGIVNHILSWPPLIPLSSLSYCVYLIHVTELELVLYNGETPYHYSSLNFTYFTLASIMVIYTASVPFFFLFEAPLVDLKNVLFKQNNGKKARRC